MPGCSNNAAAPDEPGLDAAVEVLRRGGLVVYPTETLYGLGADAFDPGALNRLVEVKGREPGKPIAVLVGDLAMAASVATTIPPLSQTLMEKFWPGPLTICLPARTEISDLLVGGGRSIGLRISSCASATELVRRLGRPLTSPSANPAGRRPPVEVEAARAYFGDRVDAYVDGGRLPGEPPSTVVEVEDGRISVRRAGAISQSALAEFGDVVGPTPAPAH